jgi:hypothetical protein
MIPYNTIDIETFKNVLGIRESSNDYYNDNKITDAWGKYQFIPARRLDVAKYLKVNNPTRINFTPEIQEMFFLAHVQMMLNDINRLGLYNFIGQPLKSKNKGSAEINIYGLLAGSHLGGTTGLNNLLKAGKDAKDYLGTYVSDYVVQFSNKVKKKTCMNQS